jgi:hypothetical protein
MGVSGGPTGFPLSVRRKPRELLPFAEHCGLEERARMPIEVTDHDRRIAEELRALFADMSGFWLKPGDESPLSQAIARYRIECEQRMIDKLDPLGKRGPADHSPAILAVNPKTSFPLAGIGDALVALRRIPSA